MKHEDYLQFGQALLDETRQYILQSIKDGFDVEEKEDKESKESEKKDKDFVANFVTEVDKGTEDILRDAIMDAYPDHGIVGEEHGTHNADADYIWYLDPIDGTSEFVAKSPRYGTLLSLYHKGEPIVGMIDHPSFDLRLWATKGGGTYKNGKRISLNDIKDASEVSDQIIAAGPRFLFERHGAEDDYDKLTKAHGDLETIVSCYGHTQQLDDKFGAVVDYHLRIWDISPVRLLIEEAGGKFIEREQVERNGETMYAIIIGKPKVVDWIVGLLDKK
ncbi:MAG TPA: inositol monophosphatase family protein [Patescibacteria group bacterium]|nr:inositol monophosphatase family protein [Patescibacteria group bacterium]